MKQLAGLWRETSFLGPDVVRKLERKYALTTEYLIKGGYAWLIKKATKASYDEPLPVTAVVIDRLPPGFEKDFPKTQIVRAGDPALVLVPRYDQFMYYAAGLATKGASFREIAGNGEKSLAGADVAAVDRKAGHGMRQVAGAFGLHRLRHRLDAPERLVLHATPLSPSAAATTS